MATYRLSWKGVLLSSEALLYTTPDTAQFILIPILLLLYLPKLLFSYLRITENGIELFYWPNYHLSAKWEEIEQLGKVSYIWNNSQDVLIIRRIEGKSITQGLDRHQAMQEKRIIPLEDFRGWPEGNLSDELQKHIPVIVNK